MNDISKYAQNNALGRFPVKSIKEDKPVDEARIFTVILSAVMVAFFTANAEFPVAVANSVTNFFSSIF